MKALLQRVSEASVTIEGEVVGAIGPGLLVFFCAERDDPDEAVDRLAAKIAKLRIFRDDAGRMNRSIVDAGGAVLAVSQFTLAADTSRGNRPGFSGAAAPDEGARLYDAFCAALAALGLPVETGRFGAEMAVALVNDGPVTIWLEA
jgi:D-tyrosyl-tRNA(Tyr) deacylase